MQKNSPLPGHFEVTKVTDRWNNTCYVRTDHLNNPDKTQLPFYTPYGLPWTCTKAGVRAMESGQPISIHRDNIAKP